MAFPSSQSTQASLDDALKTVTAYAGAIKQRSQALINDSANGPVDGARIINYLRDLTVAKTKLAERANTPGLIPYAQAQYNSPTLDIVVEYNTMITAINGTITWLVNNFPKDATGYLLYEQLNADGTISYRSFTTAQLASLRTQLTSLVTTIA